MSAPPSSVAAIADGVFQRRGSLRTVDLSDVGWLKAAADASARKRARLCLHSDNADPVHEMLIVLRQDSRVPPHFHPRKEESMLILEGAANAVFFNDAGDVTRRLTLAPPGVPDASYFYRIQKNVIHTLDVQTPYFVFHETAAGPFDAEATVVPVWAQRAAE